MQVDVGSEVPEQCHFEISALTSLLSFPDSRCINCCGVDWGCNDNGVVDGSLHDDGIHPDSRLWFCSMAFAQHEQEQQEDEHDID